MSKRDMIKAEALRLFAARGVAAVSVQDIATACAMAKPNFYAHFGAKDDLVRELFEQGYRDYGERMRAALREGGDFAQKLARLIDLICALHDEDAQRFRFILMSQHGNLQYITLRDNNPVEIVIGLMRDVPVADAELAAAAIIGIVVQAATFCLYGRLGGQLRPLSPLLFRMCLQAVS